jgi:MT-A70
LGRRSLRKSGAYTNAERQKRWRARRRAERRRAAAEAKRTPIHQPVVISDGGPVDALEDLIRAGRRFGCFYVDPPWRFAAYNARSNRLPRYPTMTTEEICKLPIADLAAPDAVLFLWTTAGHLGTAFEVLARWGFEYVTNIAWIKNKAGLGWWVRASTNFC